jgi:hypothetical protein
MSSLGWRISFKNYLRVYKNKLKSFFVSNNNYLRMSTEIGNILNQQAEMDQNNEPTQDFGNPMSSNQDVMQARGGRGGQGRGRGGQGRGG